MASKPRFKTLFVLLLLLFLLLASVIGWGLLSPERSLTPEEWLKWSWRARSQFISGWNGQADQHCFDVVLFGVGGDTAVELGTVRLVVPGVACNGQTQTVVKLPSEGGQRSSLSGGDGTLHLQADGARLQAELAGIPFAIHDGWLHIDGESAEVVGAVGTQLYLEPLTGAITDRRQKSPIR